EAFARQGATQEDDGRRLEFGRLLAGLTPREREVVDLVVAGRHNREIAEALGISARTVEVHKARAMAKLRVENIPDLVRLNLLVKGG
ncbi:MAG TPA: sigma-70 family RNA polymerase sigma factor, partial [Azonexus sp.]|nr:sigma-70 family RNA polymerase sigma factor [Azonexus sp.]